LDTDAEAFGGFNRVIPGQEFPLTTIDRENERCFAIRLYLPARTALVIERIPPQVARASRPKKKKA
jgi:hypothetical protein